MINIINIFIKKIKRYALGSLNTYIETYISNKIEKYEELVLQQRQHINYLSQRVHALNKPIIEAQSISIHYPTLDQLIYEYKLFECTKFIKTSDQTLLLDIKGNGLLTDFRYVDQSNHKLYMKIVSKNAESVWYNCCETIQAIGLIEKDGCYCIRYDKNNKSNSYKRLCYIPSSKINGDCTIFLRFGKKKEQDIVCDDINVL